MSLKNLKTIGAIALICLGCSSSSNYDESCNFLANINVVISLNLALSQYNQLTFPSNPVYVPNVGNGGIIVNNTGIGYVAFDAADPNHVFSECSILSIDGIEAVCSCENNKYNLVTGQPMENPELRCSLKPYFVESNGNSLFISN
jgi:nitrite reductase/ring-hydroxylating ferredoxin subunit